ncbi:alpha/beta fold hydrolase [Amycolatopsis sp. H6(2020)]|nr:alpha/beta fold hydrolase [Amycolatopsis sp. H6(2020)]
MTSTATRPPLWPTLISLRSRIAFRYSATGRTAAGLFTDGRGKLLCEFWWLGTGVPGDCCRLPGFEVAASNADLTGIPSEAVPFDDGSVLFAGEPGLSLVEPGGRQRDGGRLPFRPEVIAAAPDGSRRVLFLGREGPADGECTAWLWAGPDEPARRLGELPALLLRGGGWLDRAGTEFVVNRRRGAGVRPAVLDLSAVGELADLPILPGSEGDIAWLTAPSGREVLLSSEFDGEHRLRSWRPGRSVTEFPATQGLAGVVTPMAMRPRGGAVALHVRDGLREQVVELDTDTGAVRRLAGPGERASGIMAWSEPGDGERLWSLTAGAGYPGRIIGHGPRDWIEIHDGTPAGQYDGWAPSGLERFPGAESEIEAVVCGHEDWRTARAVVVALHGGPAARWSLKFSQLFQLFADQGVTVIAPNPRGSTGYGDEFHHLITGAWAGPDLADVLALGRYVRQQRDDESLILFGASYGAYLALLAASIEPRAWSRVLAIAPMLSAARLYPEASAEVRAMIDRLDGRRPVADALGSRDVLDRVAELEAPLLVVHGDADPRIPVTQSRVLVDRLTGLGRRAGADFGYVEVAGGGHAPLDGSAELHHAAARFIGHGELPAARS